MKNKNYSKYYFILIMPIFILWLIRIHVCPAFVDEQYYFQTANQIFSGKVPIFNTFEWSFLGYITYPILLLYRIINKNLDGAVLFLRYCWLILFFTTSIYSHFIIKNVNKYASIITPILFLVCNPHLITTISYHTIPYISVYAIITLYYCNVNSPISYIIRGMAFALSTMCIPHLALFYLIFLIYSIIRVKADNRNIREIIYTNLVILLMIVCTFIIALRYATIYDFFENIITILKSKVGGHSLTAIGILKNTIKILLIYVYNRLYILLFIFIAICLNIYFINRNEKKAKILFNMTIVLILFLTFLDIIGIVTIPTNYFFKRNLSRAYASEYIDIYLIPIFLGILLIINKKLNLKDFIYIFALPFLYSVLMKYASLLGARAFAPGLYITFIFTPFLLHNIKIFNLKKFTYVYIISFLLFFSTNFFRYFGSVKDDYSAYIPYNNLNIYYTNGINKGIYSSIEFENAYIEMPWFDLKEYNIDLNNKNTIFYISPISNVINQSFDSHYSSWPCGNIFDDKLLKLYYKKYPSFIPEFLFLLNGDNFEYNYYGNDIMKKIMYDNNCDIILQTKEFTLYKFNDKTLSLLLD